MKSRINRILIMAGALLAVGIIVGGIGFMMGGATGFYLDQNGFHAAKKGTETKVIELEPFQNVEVNLKSASIELIKSDHNAVEYQLMQPDSLDTCKVQNRTLIINQKHQLFLSFFYFDFGNFVKIYYKDDSILQNIQLKTTSGQVRAQDMQGKNITLTSVSGSVKALNIKGDRLVLKSSSGRIHAERVDISDMAASTISGRIEMLDMKTKKLETSTTSGSIQLKGSFEGISNVHSTSGSVTFDNALLQNQCNYKLKSMSGSIRVNDEAFEGTVDIGAPNSIYVETTSGRIRLNFLR